MGLFSGVVSDYESSKEDGEPPLHCIGDTGLGKGHSLGHGRPHCNPSVKTHLSTSLSNCSSAWVKKKVWPPPALADCHQQEECGRVAQEVLSEARQSPMLSPSSSVPTSPAKCIVEILLPWLDNLSLRACFFLFSQTSNAQGWFFCTYLDTNSGRRGFWKFSGRLEAF